MYQKITILQRCLFPSDSQVRLWIAFSMYDYKRKSAALGSHVWYTLPTRSTQREELQKTRFTCCWPWTGRGGRSGGRDRSHRGRTDFMAGCLLRLGRFVLLLLDLLPRDPPASFRLRAARKQKHSRVSFLAQRSTGPRSGAKPATTGCLSTSAVDK